MKVLLVEDDERLATSLRHGLEAEGFSVDTVHDGLDGYGGRVKGFTPQSF